MPSGPVVLALCQLDHTLFNTQRFPIDSATARALARCELENVYVVLCSTRTRGHLELTRLAWGVRGPFACEHGAAVFVPYRYFPLTVPRTRKVAGYEAVEFGKPYGEVVATLHRVAERLGTDVIGFHDMSIEDVAAACGLPLLEARLAKLREYTEPFRIVGVESGATNRLVKALRAAGLNCQTLGRYHCVGTKHRDMGARFLCDLYRRSFGDVLVVACCDAAGGMPLWRYADIPLLLLPDANRAAAERLSATMPSLRVGQASSVGDWATTLLEIARAARTDRQTSGRDVRRTSDQAPADGAG
jgi:mannosyl-3-phosphoglycerate phosphatase